MPIFSLLIVKPIFRLLSSLVIDALPITVSSSNNSILLLFSSLYLIAVSYTHLDVYKRQPYNKSIFMTAVENGIEMVFFAIKENETLYS